MAKSACLPAEITSPARTEKPWGYELLWASTGRYAGKILHIEAGARLSLQFHERKEESLYVLSGRMRMELELEDGTWFDEVLAPGACIHVAPGRRHRMMAVETCDVLEVSTPDLDDIVRLHDDYGRTDTGCRRCQPQMKADKDGTKGFL
jgi:mannose-6-phosphate isomerase-like protein (cupin superfamily)